MLNYCRTAIYTLLLGTLLCTQAVQAASLPGFTDLVKQTRAAVVNILSLIHISEPTRRRDSSRMPSSA